MWHLGAIAPPAVTMEPVTRRRRVRPIPEPAALRLFTRRAHLRSQRTGELGECRTAANASNSINISLKSVFLRDHSRGPAEWGSLC